MLRTTTLTIAALLFAASTAFAQRSGASIDVSGLNMRYADSINANAVAVTPSLWAESNFTSASANGTLSSYTGGGWSAQGNADASLFTKAVGRLFGEFEGSAGGSTRNDLSRTAQMLGSVRAHFAGADQGAWIGVGAGSAWDGSTWRSIRQAEVAGWARFGYATAALSATPVVVDDSIKYTDAQLSAEFNLPLVELSASGGLRNGNRLPTIGGTAKSWGSVSIAGWIASHIAIVASAGTYPVDFTQGFPGGRFASLGIRLGQRRFVPTPTSMHDVEQIDPTTRVVPRREMSLEIRNSGGSTRLLRLNASSAKVVEVMGDFTAWKPVRLSSEDSRLWTGTFQIEPGIHEMNVRVDGGNWIVPSGIASRKDEFGGSVGIVVIR
jgi:hypothetical protein